ncbi:hypothetical protein [Curtobacterium sp. MCPF17_052]|uniref:hypothetical protein n=1 Tax=Curtobacterium sp. MCPF17_052 TaxID=2175655 RepID=UPI0034640506
MLSPEQEPAVAVDEDDGDDPEQQADGDRPDGVEHGEPGDLVQEDTEERDDQADERGGVLGEDGPERRVRRLQHVPEDRDAALRRGTVGLAERLQEARPPRGGTTPPRTM